MLCCRSYSHSDLALRNCYLTADLTVKVGDYGIGPYRYKVSKKTRHELFGHYSVKNKNLHVIGIGMDKYSKLFTQSLTD